MKYALNILLLFTLFQSSAQNIVENGDFEIQDSCPISLGQVYLSPPWQSTVLDADYYNCGFTSTSYPSDGTAASGTGYMGFTVYGDTIGNSEAIGQNLSNILLPNTQYEIQISIKKVSSGFYSQSCAGTFIYGLNTTLPNDTLSMHASMFPGSQLLCNTTTITDTIWTNHVLYFNPNDTIRSIIITAEQSPLCNQCTFVDGITLNEYLGIKELVNSSKELIYILDTMGRETEDKPNTLLIYVYSDGTTEKVYRVK